MAALTGGYFERLREVLEGNIKTAVKIEVAALRFEAHDRFG